MRYWLVKTEPSSWSWDQQIAAGREGTFWSGVRNHTAKRYLMAMQVGERAFFYHSGSHKAVVGVVEVIKPYYPDPSDAGGQFGMVDLRAVEPLPAAVPLRAIKDEPRLANMMLVRNSRLSVQPVTADEWEVVCDLGGLTRP